MLAGIVGAGFLSGILNAMAGGDDDEDYFNKIDPYVLERNAIFMRPGTDGKYVKIPLPWGYNLFWNIGVEFSKMFTKNNYDATDGAMHLASTFANAFNPIASGTLLQTLSPTIADPFAMVAENKNWFGGDLMPAENKFSRVPTPDSQRYWKTAGPASKWVSATLNDLTGGNKVRSGAIDVSPETLDLVVDTLGGSAFRVFRDAFTLPYKAMQEEEISTYEVPFLRRLSGEQSEWSDSRDYYKNVEDVLTARNEAKAYVGTPYYQSLRKKASVELSLVAYAEKTENSIRKLKRIKNNAEAKGNKQAVKNLEARIRAVQKQFNRVYNRKKNEGAA